MSPSRKADVNTDAYSADPTDVPPGMEDFAAELAAEVRDHPGPDASDRRLAAQAAKIAEKSVDEFNTTHPGTSESVPARRKITFTRASGVRTEAVDWLLDCWVPRGSVTLLGGREGIGKSTIAVDWVAQATRGQLTGTPMNVAYVVTEDSPEHTVVPRLTAAGADLDRVMFLAASVPDPDDPGVTYEGALDLPGDYPILRRFIEEEGIGLVVLDAAKSVMSSKLKGNDDLDIRRFLEPMHRVAQDADCTFVCLVHFSAKKGSADTGNLIMGSSAWQQVARSVIAVAQDKKNETVKVWNSKANLAPRIRTMEAKVVSAEITTDDGRRTEVGRIDWIGECDEDGSDLLLPDTELAESDNRTDAEVWLTDFLAGHGDHPKKVVLAEAQKVGLTVARTLERAFKKIGGVADYKGFPRVAHWSLPVVEAVATVPVPLTSVATVATGPEQAKQRVATGPENAAATGSTAVATGDATGAVRPSLAVVPELTEPSDADILAALDTEYGLAPATVAGSVPGLTRDAAPVRLEALATAGLVTVDHRGRYIRKDLA
ncbi:AAA family ATPase [Corynebacterium sp.]|uniref:AAA family ATPase n=1 Tax=Corynebacterium sp. TaxID=1720 RepID=UPI0025C20112|nr:AAA family ATPase [Corynebacterium sp.]